MTKVSIIVPTYKREEEILDRALQTLLGQTYEDIEIVVVDDNPPDSDYRKRIRDFMGKYRDNSKIVYHENQENLGGAMARNEGIKIASGDYVSFLDDDDTYLPEKISRQLKYMKEKDADLCFTDLKLVNEEGKTVDYRDYSFLQRFDNDYLLKMHLMRHLTGTPTFMLKRDKLIEIGGFEDVKMGQEFYLMLKAIEKGLKICHLKGSDVVAYRHSGESISMGDNKIRGENKLYEFKQEYFHLLNKKERRFIKFRHYAVLAVAYKRNKNYLKSLGYIIKMFFSSPLDFFREGWNFTRNIFRHSRED